MCWVGSNDRLSFGPCLQKVLYGLVFLWHPGQLRGNFLHVKFIFNLTWLINMIALSILRIHNYTTIQWHFILCTVNPSYDCSQVIRELWYVIMQLVHLAGQSSMHNIRNRQPKTQIWHHPEQSQYQVDIGVSLYNILA
jgi:hypothetical protein